MKTLIALHGVVDNDPRETKSNGESVLTFRMKTTGAEAPVMVSVRATGTLARYLLDTRRLTREASILVMGHLSQHGTFNSYTVLADVITFDDLPAWVADHD